LRGLSRTWWRAKRGTQPSWRGLGPQWSKNGVQKERMRRGLRMAPEKVRKKGLYHPPSVIFSGFVFFLI